MPYVEVAELANWLRIEDDTEDIALRTVVEQAAQDIDSYCGRTFDTAAGSATARVFPARWTDLVYVDDISTTTDLAVAVDTGGDGTYDQTWTITTDFQVEPLNQRQSGLSDHPYYRIRAVGAKRFPVTPEARVEVTARWGWDTIPAAVKTASLLHAARLHARRNSAAGLALEAAFPTRTMFGIDKDAQQLLAPFVRADLVAA